MPKEARKQTIDEYAYELPDERIARYPLEQRSDAKLLQYRGGNITDHRFDGLPDLLRPGTMIVGNRTKVIHARLHFPLPGNRPVEVFCLEPLHPEDYAVSLSETGVHVTWKCLIGGNRRWKSGTASLRLQLQDRTLLLLAERIDRMEDAFSVRFSWQGSGVISFGEILEVAGTIPLPPYLGRAAEIEDRDRYQTVFAEREGSVAAPTAGLHFTPEVLRRLDARGITLDTLTLHVGAGTFKPVTAEALGDHVMHREYFVVRKDFLRRLRDQIEGGRPIVSVGTTSLRCLESLFYVGAKLLLGDLWNGSVRQWEASDPRYDVVQPAPALGALLHKLEREGREDFAGYTQLMLSPGGPPRLVDALITNFHQPRSTLLLLVAGVIGADWRKVYDHALAGDYRFLSYGDSSLLWRRTGAQ